MGNYEELKQAVSDVIKTNGNQEITGAILQNALLSIISTVGGNATFAGIATPTTNPGTPDQNIFYIASDNGTYVNFGGVEINDEVAILSNKSGNWVKNNTGLVAQQQIANLSNDTIVKSSRITAISNPSLNPELPIEFTGLGDPVKIEDSKLPEPLKKAGLNYYLSKTKGSNNLELYPTLSASNAVMPTKNQYVRISYIIWNIDNPIVGVTTITSSRVRLFLSSGSKIIVRPINANISKLADKTYKVDLLYKLPDFNTITSFFIEIICETDNLIPSGRTVYVGGINVVYSNDISLALDNELALCQANTALSIARKAESLYAKKEIVDALAQLFTSKFFINSAIEGGNLDPIKDLSILSSLVYSNDNEYLNDLGITKIGTANKNSSGNVECYAVFNTDKKQEYFENSGKYIKVKWFIFSKNGVMCTISRANRLGLIGISDKVSYSNGKVTYKQVNSQVFEVTATWLINQSTLPSYIYICSVWENNIVPEDWVVGDLCITGFGVWYADTLAELEYQGLNYDWIYNPNELVTLKQGDERYAFKSDIPDLSLINYNNIAYNQTAIAEFLKNILQK